MGIRKPERAEWVRRDLYEAYSIVASGAFAASTAMGVFDDTTYEAVATRLFIITPGDNIYQVIERNKTAGTNPSIKKEYQKEDPNDNIINIEGTFDDPVVAYGSDKELAVVALNGGNYDVRVSMEVFEHVMW